MAKKFISAGGIQIGGGAPISIQTMTTTKTSDVKSTITQISALADLGCDIIRVAVPDKSSAYAIEEIKKNIRVPLIADIHFDYKLALLAIELGADKIRINPGNIGIESGIKAIAKMCKTKGIPIRVGVNSGSLSQEILAKYGGITADALIESATHNIRLLNKYDFDDICLSVKTSSVSLTVETYRKLHEITDYPLHIGVTEAGTEYSGIVKSSIGIGALLLDGIGDTIRVSLTASPEAEVKAATAILKALGKRSGFDLISCPSCGRCGVNLVKMACDVDKRLKNLEKAFGSIAGLRSVAVMGCAVNGPGEASNADYGVACGKTNGVLFKKGKIISKLPEAELAGALINEIITDEKLIPLQKVTI